MRYSTNWIRILEFLDGKQIGRISEISENTSLSWTGSCNGVKDLEKMGLVTLEKVGRKVSVVPTKKYYSLKPFIEDILKVTVI